MVRHAVVAVHDQRRVDRGGCRQERVAIVEAQIGADVGGDRLLERGT